MKTYKFFKRDVFGQAYEVPVMDDEVEYVETTETLTIQELKDNYPLVVYKGIIKKDLGK